MSASKSKFQTSSASTTKPGKTSTSAIKKNVTTAVTGIGGPSTNNKTGPIQVIFNGKIVTPQSLIPRKGTRPHGDHSKKHKSIVPKSLTIDEGASDAGDMGKIANNFASRLNLKKNEPSESSKHGMSRANVIGGKAKPVVEETVTFYLSETTTNMILAIPSFLVASDTREVMITDERNTRYDNCLKAHKNVDSFTARASQTKNNQLKNQNEMAAPNAFRDFGTQAISYQITDETSTANSTNVETDLTSGLGITTEAADDLSSLNTNVKKFVEDTVAIAQVTPGVLLDTATAIRPMAPGESSNNKSKSGGTGGGKNRSMLSVNPNKHGSTYSVNGGTSEAMSGEDVTTGGQSGFIVPNKGGGGKQDKGSESGNESGHDIVSKANVSQSNLDSQMDSEEGGGGGSTRGYETFTESDSIEALRENQINQILSSPMLLKRLHMIERAIQQNANYRSQLDYRDLPDIAPMNLLSPERAKQMEQPDQLFGGSALGGKPGLLKRQFTDRSKQMHLPLVRENSNASIMSESTDSPTKNLRSELLSAEHGKVKKLFSYANPELIQNRVVTCMAWNAASPDLLAVGYGRSLDIRKANNADDKDLVGDTLTDEALQGLVLFWSLRNPDYPEKILRTAHSVTAVDFSKIHPMTLAVGLSNGDVNIYDVKREGPNWSIPVESSAGMQGSHLDPVWQVKWIVKGVERSETLVSISTDGRVLEWNLKKGLLVSTLMQLKKSGTGEGWISNSSAGLCFDFNPSDPTTYITGTEDGSLFRCSVSYNEQYLETYQNHEAPVYRVKFCPRWSSVFLSGSADWCMNLYHLNSKVPLLSMRATGENFPINDIAWCPGNSTVFAAVTMDAKVQIWDLNVSSIDPVVTIDIGSEDKAEADRELDLPKSPAEDHAMLPPSPSLTASRFQDKNDTKDDDPSPVHRLLKKLGVASKKRILTTVLFGEKSPILAVGDDRGVVNIYRVFDPIMITHQGPLQQYNKIKQAVIRQTDPSHVTLLEHDGEVHEEKH